MMNEKQLEEAIKATAIELSSMSSEELRAEVEKRENCDFARIFVETGEASDENLSTYPAQIKQHHLTSAMNEDKLEELLNRAIANQLQQFLPIMVEKIVSETTKRFE
jgi:hypothetical protein